MHRQYYTLCCKNNCCKQENCKNAQWTNFIGCKNYPKDSRNRYCNNGVTKGFVQNLKDKIVNLQYDNPQIQFAKKTVKKKQKDYYCLMLRKINNLDKKLQNLEHLFISHLNHTPKEVLNSKDKEPLYDYLDFYDSVRSLVDVANRLKEDIIYKQYDNHVPNKNTLHLDDRIQVLDSELQNLYRHLEDLQNYTDEIKGRKQLFVKDRQDVPHMYSGYRIGPKTKSYKLQEVVCRPEEDCRNASSQCVECCYEADEDTPVSCHCSGCNLSGYNTVCPDNRRYKVVECCRGETVSKDSDCSCVVCVSERKNGNKFRKKKLWISQSTSSCSCEMCISTNRKLCVQKHNSARIKIIKPAKKVRNDEDFFRELEISYHELEPNKSDKKKNQKNKNKKKNLNEDDPDVRVERTYYQDVVPTSNSMTAFQIKSRDGSILENTPEKYVNKQHKVHSPTYNQRKDLQKVVYYEVAPNLNIITKRRNKGQVINSGQENNRKVRKNKRSSKKAENNRNSPNRMFTVNFEENNPLNENFEKTAKGKKISSKYQNDQSSSESENLNNVYVTNKKFPYGEKNKNKLNGEGGKHLHIKIRQNKDLEERVIVEGNVRSPEDKNKYKKNQTQRYHRKHSGFCHVINGKDAKELYSNRKYSKYSPYNGELSESDSFETLEEYESSSQSCESQYKVFFCDDPNCVDKLDSDELIMLMDKTDLKHCGANPYKLSIQEDIKQLKTDVCEKCTVKERSITVTPRKTGNKKINEKDKFILKKEVVECSKCKNKVNDKLSNIAITERKIEYVNSAMENENSKKLRTSNKSSNSDSTGSNIQHPNQEREIKLNGSKTEKSNSILAETDYQEQQIDTNTVKKQTSNRGSKTKSTTVLACNEMGQKTVFKSSNENSSTSNSPKPLELQGFGNLININIERGSYSVSQKPEVVSGQKGTVVGEKHSGSKNVKPNPKTNSKNDKGGLINEKSTNESNPSKIGKLQTSYFPQKNNQSSSDMNLVIDREKEFKSVTVAKSEVFTSPASLLLDKSSSKMKNESKNKITTEIIVSYMEAENNRISGKGVQSKSGVNNKKGTSNRVTEANLGNALNDLIGPRYVYQEEYNNLSTNSLSVLKKNIVRPKVSISKLKKSRLKNNKKFGPSLSRVSSVHSVIVQQAALYPGDIYPPKRPNVYNPIRRNTKQAKRKPNIYPKIIPLMKENSLSGIVKPQIKDVEKETYKNNLKIPSNDSSNSRYKVASISNYLSSTVVSETSYSTLNWETVANKLKEDDKYLNNIT